MVGIEPFDVYRSFVMDAPSAEPIGLHLARTAKAVSRAFDAALVEAGGTLPMWLVLMSLKDRRHGAQRQLAQAVGVEGPTLTHHLNRMEKAGLVTRTRDPENRRVHQVELTEQGEEAFHRLLAAVIAFDEQLRTGLSAREIAAVDSTLTRLATNVGSPAAEEVTS